VGADAIYQHIVQHFLKSRGCDDGFAGIAAQLGMIGGTVDVQIAQVNVVQRRIRPIARDKHAERLAWAMARVIPR